MQAPVRRLHKGTPPARTHFREHPTALHSLTQLRGVHGFGQWMLTKLTRFLRRGRRRLGVLGDWWPFE